MASHDRVEMPTTDTRPICVQVASFACWQTSERNEPVTYIGAVVIVVVVMIRFLVFRDDQMTLGRLLLQLRLLLLLLLPRG